MRKCFKCQQEKDESEFYTGCAYCKPCDNEYRRKYHESNAERIRDRKMQVWRKKHSRSCKECGATFIGKGVKREFCSTLCKLLGSVTKKNGCWEWAGDIHPNGYAYTTMYETNKKEHVHRISYRIFKGEIPEGLYVCHKCDNRKCISPDHLFVGTAKDNMQDAKSKGRLEHIKLMQPKGEKKGSSKLKEYQVREIRKMILEGVRLAVIARKFSVSWTTVESIKKNKTWRHVLLE